MPSKPTKNPKPIGLKVVYLDSSTTRSYLINVKDYDRSLYSFINEKVKVVGNNKPLIIYAPVKISFGTRVTPDKIKRVTDNLYKQICGDNCDDYTIGNLINEREENLKLIDGLIKKYKDLKKDLETISGLLQLHVEIKIFNPDPIKIRGNNNDSKECIKIFQALHNGYFPTTPIPIESGDMEEEQYKNRSVIVKSDPQPIELDPDVFFLLEYILIYVDLAHDIRHGLRNKKNIACHNKSANKVFKEKIAKYLEYLHNKLLVEINYFYKNIANTSEKEYKDSLLRHIAELSKTSDDTSPDGSKITLEQRTYNKIIDIIKDHNVETALRSYELTREMINKNANTKYVSNNATGLVHKINIPFFDSNTINDNAKSLPASRYDGAQATTEGGDINNAFAASRIEDGSSSIEYRITGKPNYKLSFVTYFEKVENEQSEKTLYKKIVVERGYQKKGQGETHEDVLEKAVFTFMMLQLRQDNKLSWQKIELDHELIPFFEVTSEDAVTRLTELRTNESDNKEINIGDIGKIISIHNNRQYLPQASNFQAIDTLEKSLCDLFQYINSITKGGGYNGKQQFCNIEGINPLTQIKASDFPSLVLHGDQPAAALNMYLNYVVGFDRVNQGSHMIYQAGGLKPNQVTLANCGGILTQAFVNEGRTAAEERDLEGIEGMEGIEDMEGGKGLGERSYNKNKKGGGIECYVDLPDDVMNVLEHFFKLCAEFKMPSYFIPIYNQFYISYVIGNENKTGEIFNLEFEYINLIVSNIQQGNYFVDYIKQQWNRRVIEINYLRETSEKAAERRERVASMQAEEAAATDQSGYEISVIDNNGSSSEDGIDEIGSFEKDYLSESDKSGDETQKPVYKDYPGQINTTFESGKGGSIGNKSTRKRNIQKNNKTKRRKPKVNRKHNTTQYRKQKTRKRKYNKNNNKNGK